MGCAAKTKLKRNAADGLFTKPSELAVPSFSVPESRYSLDDFPGLDRLQAVSELISHGIFHFHVQAFVQGYPVMVEAHLWKAGYEEGHLLSPALRLAVFDDLVGQPHPVSFGG